MLWVNLAPVAPPSLPPDDAVPAGWSFCRTLCVRAGAASARDVLAARGFGAGAASAPSPALRGVLDQVDTVALVLDAQPHLAFIHLWTRAAPGTHAMKALHIAARGLRGEIEARRHAA